MYRRSLAEVDAFLAEIAESRPAGIDFHAFSSTVEMTCSGYILLVFGTQKLERGEGSFMIVTLKYKCSNLRMITRLIASSVGIF